ncbi:MAG: 4'-phosphopantetheinyl transferase superfamily protein [Chlorobium sp.]|uniref:4'-phosphopantetheinyl transferase superfamily protein n=1 Tax=Chlorobium sp. TaxID=1095 RepID=UPI0025C2232C|nr:4'-phosphopantetheinyl transferase superfamily protein [Chlorobium sp.]MCF8383083.1 4'-phosphopantetheinyl transferase superfamily protein [Chlorobium sp.]
MVIQHKELHLWYTNVRTLTPYEAENILPLLSDTERNRYGKLPDAGRRNEFLITRHLVRTVLSSHLSRKPADLCFDNNQFGKPSLSPSCGLEFNISNTCQLAVCLVSFSGPVGVDIEQWSRAADVMEVMDRCFSQKEIQKLFSLPPALRPERALSLWTLKEAYLKAIGIGLAEGLNNVEFLYDSTGKPRLQVDPRIDAQTNRWHFCVTDIMSHKIALMAPFLFRKRIRIFEAKPCPHGQPNVWNILRYEAPANLIVKGNIHESAAIL